MDNSRFKQILIIGHGRNGFARRYIQEIIKSDECMPTINVKHKGKRLKNS